MRKQQQRRNYRSGIRSSGGQTTLQSFLFKPRAVDAEVRPSPAPEGEEVEGQIRPPEPPRREIVKVTRATIKEKPSAFSSVGGGSSSGKDAGGALSAAVFKRFHGSASSAPRAEGGGAGAGGDADADADVRLDLEDITAKRKSPLDGHEQGGDGRAKRVVVLGDDPRPRLVTRRGRGARPARGGDEGGGGRALYNHYASGGGWWHGDMEGVDGEEVGWTDDMWEGMGSVTLGGLEWH
ncbi:hypothetical protein ACP4OV_010666 [Aristida adscensionis]